MRAPLPLLLLLAAAGTGTLWLMDGRAPAAESGGSKPTQEALSPAPRTELAAGRIPAESEQKAASASAGAPYDIAVGTQLEFDVTFEQTSGLTRRSQSASERLGVRVTGKLQLELLDRREGELLLRVRMAKAALSLAGAADPGSELASVERELGLWTRMRMRPDGQVVGWSFDPEASARSMQVIESVLSLARFVIPPDAGTTWSAREEDASGAYLVEYERGEIRDGEVAVLRRRKEFTPRADPGMEAPANPIDDRTTAHFAAFAGWPRRIEGRQHLGMDLWSEDVGIEVLAEYSWSWTGETRRAVAPAERDWDLSWKLALPRAERSAEDDADIDWSNTSVESLLLDLESVCSLHGLQSREVYAGRELLKTYLRSKPEALERLTTVLMGGGVSESVLGVALSAIGSAGSAPGRTWLAERILDPSWEERPRLLSLLACFQQAPGEDPVQEAAGLLWRDPLAPPALRSTALLLQGMLAKGAPERAQALLAEESLARRDGFVTSFVSALGNAALPDELRRFLDHPDRMVSDTARRALDRL